MPMMEKPAGKRVKIDDLLALLAEINARGSLREGHQQDRLMELLAQMIKWMAWHEYAHPF